jgi:hypothetical protein
MSKPSSRRRGVSRRNTGSRGERKGHHCAGRAGEHLPEARLGSVDLALAARAKGLLCIADATIAALISHDPQAADFARLRVDHGAIANRVLDGELLRPGLSRGECRTGKPQNQDGCCQILCRPADVQLCDPGTEGTPVLGPDQERRPHRAIRRRDFARQQSCLWRRHGRQLSLQHSLCRRDGALLHPIGGCPERPDRRDLLPDQAHQQVKLHRGQA